MTQATLEIVTDSKIGNACDSLIRVRSKIKELKGEESEVVGELMEAMHQAKVMRVNHCGHDFVITPEGEKLSVKTAKAAQGA